MGKLKDVKIVAAEISLMKSVPVRMKFSLAFPLFYDQIAACKRVLSSNSSE